MDKLYPHKVRMSNYLEKSVFFLLLKKKKKKLKKK